VSQRWEALARLADRELALLEAGDFESASALGAERARLAAALPARPPAEARAALEHLMATHERITVILTVAREALALELGQLERGRKAVRGYGALASRPLARARDVA